ISLNRIVLGPTSFATTRATASTAPEVARPPTAFVILRSVPPDLILSTRQDRHRTPAGCRFQPGSAPASSAAAREFQLPQPRPPPVPRHPHRARQRRS